MLIHSARLILSLQDLNVRNDLIHELDLANTEDKQRFYKLILAFWLGSTPTRQRILKALFPISEAQIDGIYFVFLNLDKTISLEFCTSSKLLSSLQHLQKQLFCCFNEHYSHFVTQPGNLFNLFKTIIEGIDDSSLNLSQKNSLNAVKNISIALIAASKIEDNQAIERLIQPSSWQSHIRRFTTSPYTQLSTVTTYMLATLNDYAAINFYPSLTSEFEKYLLNKIFLRTHDGIIIDGLHVKKRGTHAKTIVLALVGHFSSEQPYIANSIIPFQTLFGTDIVFINHRNFSTRAAKSALNVHELINDVLAFAYYYHRRGKRIVLYGMCGGAACMLPVAEKLSAVNIPFKLIVDRFFQRYTDCLDVKTVLKIRNLIIQDSTSSSQSRSIAKIILPVIPLIFLLTFVLRLLLLFTKNMLHLERSIKSIPQHDILVLQGKGEKNQQGVRLQNDLFVHPKNDLRYVMKPLRQKQKYIFKSLIDLCSLLFSHLNFMSDKGAFLQLGGYFCCCLTAITYEKLYHPNLLKEKYADIHGSHLYNLGVRKRLPIHCLIQGFFFA